MGGSIALRLDDPVMARTLLALFALTALAIVFAHRGVAPAFMLMALMAAMRSRLWVDGWRAFGWPLRLDRPSTLLGATAAAFVAWIAATDFWSPVDGGWRLALNILAPILCAGAMCWLAGNLADRSLRRVASGFAAMVVVASSLVVFEGVSVGALRAIVPPVDTSPDRVRDFISLGRGVTALAPMTPPAALIVWRLTGSRLAAVALAASVFAGAVMLAIAANVVALIVGAAAFGAGLALGRLAPLAMTICAIASVMGGAFVSPAISPLADGSVLEAVAPPSWTQRTIIWREAARRAEDCQPFGCGAEYARAIHAEGGMVEMPGSPIPLPVMPTHPHNVALEIWLELGAVGLALFILMLLAAGWAWSRLGAPPLVQASVAAVVAIGVVSFLVEASFWQVWRLCALGFGAFGCALAAGLLAHHRSAAAMPASDPPR